MKPAIFLMPLVAASVLAMNDAEGRSPKRARTGDEVADSSVQYQPDYTVSIAKILDRQQQIQDVDEKSAYTDSHSPIWELYIEPFLEQTSAETCGPFLKSLYFDEERTGTIHSKTKFGFFKLKDFCVSSSQDPSFGCSNSDQAAQCLLKLLHNTGAVNRPAVKFTKFRVVSETRDGDLFHTGALIENAIVSIQEFVPAESIKQLLELAPTSYRRMSRIIKKLCDVRIFPSREKLSILSPEQKNKLYSDILNHLIATENQPGLSTALETYGRELPESFQVSTRQAAEFLLSNTIISSRPEYENIKVSLEKIVPSASATVPQPARLLPYQYQVMSSSQAFAQQPAQVLAQMQARFSVPISTQSLRRPEQPAQPRPQLLPAQLPQFQARPGQVTRAAPQASPPTSEPPKGVPLAFLQQAATNQVTSSLDPLQAKGNQPQQNLQQQFENHMKQQQQLMEQRLRNLQQHQAAQRPTVSIPVTEQQAQQIRHAILQNLQRSQATQQGVSAQARQMTPPALNQLAQRSNQVGTGQPTRQNTPARPVVSAQQQATQPTQSTQGVPPQLLELIQSRLSAGESWENIMSRLNGGN